MYIDLVVNNVVKRMQFGYIENFRRIESNTQNYVSKDLTPNIKKYGTSFKQILGDKRPTTINTVDGTRFANRFEYTGHVYSEITIEDNLRKLPNGLFPTAYAVESESTDKVKYGYDIKLLDRYTNYRVNVYVDTKSLVDSGDIPIRDFMLFATDEIIDGKRTILYLGDNKFDIIDLNTGLAKPKFKEGNGVNTWYALSYTLFSTNFKYTDIVFDILNLQDKCLFYNGTAKQAGGMYSEVDFSIVSNVPYYYGNLIPFNDGEKTFFKPHFSASILNDVETWYMITGKWLKSDFITRVSDPDNPEPPTPPIPDLPTPDPENPTDPDNPDNPDNLEPEPSDPIPKPRPSPSPTFSSRLLTAYKLSPDNLSALADEMWTSSFYNNIVKMFQSPMDCLVSLSEFPIDVPSGVTKNIQLGNVEMSTAGQIISNPFVAVDLGTVTITEKYKSYLDYMNTQLIIYLPFIGFEQISIDYMNSQLQLQYNVDILSGNCVAILYAISYNSNLQSVVGQWNGNMAYSIPLSGRDFSNMASSLWNTAMSAGSVIASSRIPAVAASGFAKGSAAGFGAPSLGSVADLGNNIINTIEAANATTSGGHLSANAGHLGVLQPYIIISRPVQKINASYYASYGRILDAYTSFSALSGFTKVKSCNLFIAGATTEEVREIERLLKEGVIF